MKELRGMPVVNALAEQFNKQVAILKEQQIIPKLAVVRIGEREDDIAYEKGILKRFSAVNAAVEIIVLPYEVNQEALEAAIYSLNNDSSVHGILLFRPLPKHISQERIKNIISNEKDVDCMGTANAGLVYEGNGEGYAPCTAQAVIEMLDFYGMDTAGKKITIIGRSLVVGKPLAMLLLNRNATITICHTKTLDLANECKKADILIACAGVAGVVKSDFVHRDQIVIDVGIHVVEGKLCGDVDYAAVAENVAAITPVPGGVGTVTTSVLLKHTINSAMKILQK